jgi:Uncharacterized conserved protein
MIDLQSTQSIVEIYLDQVGIKGLKHPVTIKMKNNTTQPSIATFNMGVGLPAQQRGTHMSRFVEIFKRSKLDAINVLHARVIISNSTAL